MAWTEWVDYLGRNMYVYQTYIHPSIHPSIHPYMHACMHACIYTYVYVYVYIRVCVFVCVYLWHVRLYREVSKVFALVVAGQLDGEALYNAAMRHARHARSSVRVQHTQIN